MMIGVEVRPCGSGPSPRDTQDAPAQATAALAIEGELTIHTAGERRTAHEQPQGPERVPAAAHDFFPVSCAA